MKTLVRVLDDLHGAQKRGIVLELPGAVRLCPVCNGLGEYKQTYTAGCGMGTYISTGACDYCDLSGLWFTGSGFKYKNQTSITNEGSVPKSVLFQIYNMNKNVIEVIEQFES